MDPFNVTSEGLVLKASSSIPLGHPNHETVVLFGGFLADQLSDKADTRAQALLREAQKHAIRLVRFNYMAHGETEAKTSEGRLQDITITKLIQNAVDVCASLKTERISIVGSSIGAGIVPYVRKRLYEQNSISTEAVLSISALPPAFLRDFILAQLTAEQVSAFDLGQIVQLSSPTLPVPIPVSAAQFSDLSEYSTYPKMSKSIRNGNLRLLFGAQDPASSLETNLFLSNALGGDKRNTVCVNQGHEISHDVMLDYFRSWIINLLG